MQGPDRKTPLPDGDGAFAPAGPASARAEAETTPEAASISAAEPDRTTGRRRAASGRSPGFASGFASRASALLARVPGLSRIRGAGLRATIAAAGGAVTLALAALAPAFFARGEPEAPPRVAAATLAGTVSGLGALVDGTSAFAFSGTADARADAGPENDAGPDAGPPRPAVWRLSQLAADPEVTVVDVPIQHKPLLPALAGAKVSRGESTRLATSLGDVHDVDHFGPKDALIVALDKPSGRVLAYELASSPAEVWQGREDPQQADGGEPPLLAKRLKLEVERVRVRKAVLVGADLHASFVEAGLAPIDDLVAMLDDALEGHAELSDIRPGSRLRIIATQDQVDGAFVRWVSLEAVEYFPAAPNAPSARVYRFGDEDEAESVGGLDRHPDRDSSRHDSGRPDIGKKRSGWYDARGRQPSHGGWRTPVPLARITSRFNPHRMHPVLHIIMPHNGVDFAAPVGTPVYATAAGTVTSVGNAGPCGNRVEISHPNNIQSIYCHLSRYAAGLHVGLHVEQRQLIAYVGQTGRVTGPHLHFGIRRAGLIIDPMTLRLDGVRVVPRALRDEFDRQRAALDAELDGVALPASTGVPAEAPEPSDSFYNEEP